MEMGRKLAIVVLGVCLLNSGCGLFERAVRNIRAEIRDNAEERAEQRQAGRTASLAQAETPPVPAGEVECVTLEKSAIAPESSTAACELLPSPRTTEPTPLPPAAEVQPTYPVNVRFPVVMPEGLDEQVGCPFRACDLEPVSYRVVLPESVPLSK
jgi:hypothetical protein